MSMFNNYTKQQLVNMLKEAQDALHALLTGTKAVTVNRAGRSVQFNQTTRHDLESYINELKRAVGISVDENRRTCGRVLF